MLHLGTATALLLFFWRDWWALVIGVLGLTTPHQVTESRRVFLLIVIATIPAVIVGFLAEKFFRNLFGTPVVAAIFLMVNALLLWGGEKLRGHGHRPLSGLTMADALTIGIWQCAALIPGISRSGATIVGGLLRGINHEGAAHFSFLIATPIILGATVLEVPKLLHESVPAGLAGAGGGRRACRHHRLCQHMVPDALFPPARSLGAQSVRVLLLRRWRRQPVAAAGRVRRLLLA